MNDLAFDTRGGFISCVNYKHGAKSECWVKMSEILWLEDVKAKAGQLDVTLIYTQNNTYAVFGELRLILAALEAIQN